MEDTMLGIKLLLTVVIIFILVLFRSNEPINKITSFELIIEYTNGEKDTLIHELSHVLQEENPIYLHKKSQCVVNKISIWSSKPIACGVRTLKIKRKIN